jgi:hypothetical protein
MPITYADSREPAHFAGRPPKIHEFIPADVTETVNHILRSDRSNRRSNVLDILNEFVILTEHTLYALVHERVSISDNINTFRRQLRIYKNEGLISDATFGVIKAVLRAGLPKPITGSLRAYCLGPTGVEYIHRKIDESNALPVKTTEDHLAHDLICAEAMIKLRVMWKTHPVSAGLVEVRGPHEVSIWDPEKKVHVVAPDGLLIKRKLNGDYEGAFLVEYQNVRSLLQVQAKLKKYEEIANSENNWIWNSWELDEMPWVLIIYRQGATLQHYLEEIARRGEMAARFAAIALEDIWAGNLFIKPLRGNR